MRAPSAKFPSRAAERAHRIAASALLLAAGATLAVAAGAPRPNTAPIDSSNIKHVSSLRHLPGYSPPVDAESMSVLIGRRVNAPVVSKPFKGGARTLDDLGRAVCRMLHRNDRDSLLALCVSQDEFTDIMWLEFPQSRPATGLQWEDAWTMHYARIHAGSSHAVRDYGGHLYQFMGFERDSVMHYKNFSLHNHLILVAKDDLGDVQKWRWLRSVAERKGRFKIWSTDD
ncbi:MAG TPA: hypothetical protein VMJ70_16265 [Candidatus Sulfotelmatobacter sp.]|nr:hypothetical protein [Candidatus Sulfotelmatobacter sp.]